MALILFLRTNTGLWSESISREQDRTDAAQARKQSTPPQKPIALQEFPVWLRAHLQSLEWGHYASDKKLSRDILRQSLNLGRRFLINNQKPAGNFNYQYDFVRKEMDPADSQVRQAGVLWGLALLYQYDQDQLTRAALEKGLNFFFEHTKPGFEIGSLLIQYPGESRCQTGTVALVGLSLIEFLRLDKTGRIRLTEDYKEKLEYYLNGYLEHLKSMRLTNKHFSASCSLNRQKKTQIFSPYYDGESMLCLIKAAKYLEKTDLIPLIEESALPMARYYTADQWPEDPDSKLTKGFFQWSCMAFWEYQDAGWKNSDALGDYVLSLAWWMIHVHRTLERTRNTAYAYEGLIHAYELAKTRGHQAARAELEYVIDRGLHSLTTWQVGGPLSFKNKFLMTNRTDDPLALGGIMNHEREAPLRIDVAQHQLHALLLALKYVYQD